MSTSTSTSSTTVAFTRAHTATYLADALLGGISDILGHLGISTFSGAWNLDRDTKAIAEWIKEESLDMVILECHRPDGSVSPVFEFPVRYTADVAADAAFSTSHAALGRYRAKLESVPSGTSFRLLCTYRKSHSAQTG